MIRLVYLFTYLFIKLLKYDHSHTATVEGPHFARCGW